jgi:hypothetical protein
VCKTQACDPNRYRCDNDRCVHWSSLCDGVDDCAGDGQNIIFNFLTFI